jgi:hypothetical protein
MNSARVISSKWNFETYCGPHEYTLFISYHDTANDGRFQDYQMNSSRRMAAFSNMLRSSLILDAFRTKDHIAMLLTQ